MNIYRSRRTYSLGATLVEVLITTGVFSVLMLVLFTVVQYGMDSWRSIEGRTVTQTMMRKIGVFAMDDIRRASFGGLGVAIYTNYNPKSVTKVVTGTDIDQDKNPNYGQAIWMLSAYNDNSSISTGGADAEVISASERFARSDSGIPSWSKNVIYYVSAIGPNLHKEKYQESAEKLCGGADSCPHKWLIRCEVPQGALLDKDSVKNYLVQPEITGGQLNLFSGNLKDCKVQVLADCIVAFRAVTSKPEVTLVIKSARLAELRRAQQQRGVVLEGTEDSPKDLSNAQALRKLDTLSGATSRLGAYTLQYDITVIPRNSMK